MFDERGWVVKDSDLPPKRNDRKKFKAKEASGMKYLKDAGIKVKSPEKKPSEQEKQVTVVKKNERR
ncbi:hypothetical protein ES708_20948 [subsurface metagenome]